MSKFTYKNLNGFTVIVPGKRGVGIAFPPGQGSTDPWFSRFVGPRKLSRVLIGEDGDMTPPGPPKAPPALKYPPPDHNRQMLEQVESEAEEDTDYYVRKQGIFYCKRCELFRTGSRDSMVKHLQFLHKLELDPDEERTPPPAPAEALPPGPEDEPSPSREKPDKEYNLVDGIYCCPYCDRQYKTEKGVVSHIESKHRQSSAVEQPIASGLTPEEGA